MYINLKDWSEWYKFNRMTIIKQKFSFYTGKNAPVLQKTKVPACVCMCVKLTSTI